MPEKVTVTVTGNEVTVKGPKAELKRAFDVRQLSVKADGNKVKVASAVKPNKRDKRLAGTIAAHIRNMVNGSQKVHQYVLKICSGHFPMNVAVSGDKFTIKNFFGEKVPRTLQIRKGATVKVEGDRVIVESHEKEIAGQVSADIELFTKRTDFDNRIFQDGIYIVSKDGKEVV